jgi:hypothetical protein
MPDVNRVHHETDGRQLVRDQLCPLELAIARLRILVDVLALLDDSCLYCG